MQETIHLSHLQFVNAITMGGAIDINHVDRNFEVRNDFGGGSTYVIKNVAVSSDIYLIAKEIPKRIVIENCIFQSIYIADCAFLNGISFEEVTCNNISVRRTRSQDHFELKSTKAGSISFNFLNFGQLLLSELDCYSINLDNGKSDFITIYGAKIKQALGISNIIGIKNLEVNNVNALSINIASCRAEELIAVVRTEAKGDFILNGDIDGRVLVDNIKASKLLSKFLSWGREKEFLIKQSQVHEIFLPSVKEKCSLIVQEVEFNFIELNGFNNLGHMQWGNLNPVDKSKILIYGSNTGKWDLIGCDLSQTRLSISKSKILDAFYTNTIFPNALSLPEDIDPANKELGHTSLRDAYNQLKTIAHKQNDRRYYLHFQAAEMASYYETVSWRCSSIFNKVQLWFMMMSNGFGINWQRGVLFVAVVNLIFLSIVFRKMPIQLTSGSICLFGAHFFEFMFALTNKPDFVKCSEQVIVYYVSRIFIAFGIYQTISAFRKYGKAE
ncbi:MAG TPA: hypothetical protein PLW44_06410 [Chitinophagales bacterium]|nr:hypothetical protein [Chitinophagales bacterium]